ncbi:hypothetical protein BUALT_Bualt09G0106400 [Buddleja alternifolia]|uniref:Transmembrane protein n=1 Tax=Buddleja alternifolia TaxID=168488 RepID=A0AAV6XA35_9LAMI|nr:hypothetical protein BUALT_Bualt09G0106400 [Buddleja alternifolia]
MKTLSFLFSNSLFSTIVTLYILIFLYLPSVLLQFILSPVVISTIILLLYLLRLGAEQNSTNESDSAEFNSTESPILHDHRDHEYVTETAIELESSFEPDLKENPNLFHADSFVEWDVRAPLEVIHEEHGEGEEIEGNDGVSEENRESQIKIIQRYASLSLFYPESDSDVSSEENFPTNGDCDSPENTCFRWEEEEDRDGLIEIELDEKRNNEVDEENLIEIDLFPAR